MPRRNDSVALTASLALMAVTTLALVAAGAQLYRSRRARLREDLRTSVAANADRAAIALALPIWSFDRGQIDRVVESTLREPEIYAVAVHAPGKVHAAVRDAQWRPVAYDGARPPPAPADEGLLREERTVKFGDEPIGRVAVYATPRFVRQELRDVLVSSAVLVAALEAALVAILSLVLWRVVLEPLRAVQRYAEAVSSGGRPEVAPPGTRFRGELEALRAAIRRMVTLLDTRYAELNRSQEAIHALAARLQAVREEEKARIARDLHDDLGQLLTGIKMHLRWVEAKLGAVAEPPAAGALVDRVVEATALVDQTVSSVQRIAADLRPSALDRLGLGAALGHECRHFQERTGIACDCVLDDAVPELSGEAATALYRVAQEALTNVARHAGASRVQVALRADGRAVRLRVEDDGRGIEDGAGPEALGLLGMRERAAIFGGDVTFARGPERGTVVDLCVPLERVVRGASGGRR
jgi:signal transduction histidine kinase